MKSYNEFKNKPFYNEWGWIALGAVLSAFILKYQWIWIILLIYSLLVYRKLGKKIVFLLFFFYAGRSFLFWIPIPESAENVICRVEEPLSDGYSIWYKGNKILIQDKNHSFMPGDYIRISFEKTGISAKSYETDFDYKTYILSNGIRFTAKGNDIEFIRSGFSLKRIKVNSLNILESKLKPETFAYVKTMVFAENELEDTVNDGFSALGLSHILAISGMHIMLLFQAIGFLIWKVFHSYRSFIPLFILSIYVLVIGYPPAATRALLFLFLQSWNKQFVNPYSSLNLWFICLTIMIVLFPYLIFHSGFQLSFMASLILIFIPKVFSFKNRIARLYCTYFLLFGGTLPIVSGFYPYVSFLALLLSPVLTAVLSFVLVPICYILVLFPFTDMIFQYIFLGLNMYITTISKFSFGISIPVFIDWQKGIYYLFYGLLCISLIYKKSRRYTGFCFGIAVLLLTQFRYLRVSNRITFIDVGQGDSALIELAYSKKIMLIDAFHCFDFLESTGIDKIDYLVLTHSDADHIEDAEKIIRRFKVKHILVSAFDEGFENWECTRVTNRNHFYLGDILVDVLAPINRYSDKNSNSLVLQFNIDGVVFLFCGDMTVQEEEDVVNLYGNRLKSTVLKVGHHGSDTSSSIAFLNAVDPKVSVISVGWNYYGLPKPQIVERLNSYSRVLQTKDCGNIVIDVYKENRKVKPYRYKSFKI